MSLPTLDPIEIRVLGSLIEKSITTPESYPLTLNAVRSACNQRSSRDPVMDLSERDVSAGVDRLQRRRLVGTASGAGHRVAKFRHAMDSAVGLSRRELAVLSVLMLRGPQTAGEIGSRAGRMGIAGAEDAAEVLWMLGDREVPLVVSIPRAPGQSADRFAHTLSGETPAETDRRAAGLPGYAEGETSPHPPSGPDALTARVARLEEELAALRDALTGLRQRLGDLE
jgi:uncharacterized protein YceH (UPF0502 family)